MAASCTPAVEYEDFDLSIGITKTNKTNRILGTYNPDITEDIGWKLDITKMMPDAFGSLNVFPNNYKDSFGPLGFEDNNRNHLYAKLLEVLPRDGVPYEFWQPGVNDAQACEFKRLRTTELDKLFPVYVPIIKTGGYYIGPGDYYMYSDVSFSQRLPYYGRTDLATHLSVDFTYAPDLKYPVGCRMYKRNSCGAPLVHIDLSQADTFLGTVVTSDGALIRQKYYTAGTTDLEDFEAARDIDNINWDLVDRDMRLFTIDIFPDTPTLDLRYVLNSAFRSPVEASIPETGIGEPIAFENATSAQLDASYVGTASGRPCQVLYTKYFPLAGLSKLMVFDGIGYPSCISDYVSTAEEWTEVLTFDFSFPTDTHFIVDYDLGLVIFGGKKADATLLNVPISSTEDRFTLLDATNFSSRGIVVVTDRDDPSIQEMIIYYGRLDNDLLNVARGQYGTTARAWPVDALVEELQKGKIPASVSGVFASYTPTFRLEYELLMENEERERTPTDIDINPMRNSESEGLLYTYRCLKDVAYLSIEVLDKEFITTSDEIYGPVYLGSDFATLKVTAYGGFDQPLSNAPVTIHLEGPGFISGPGSDTAVFYTGSDGSFTFVYKTPSNPEEMGTYSTLGSISAGNTSLEFDDSASFIDTSLDEIYLYEVTKDSPMLGSRGYTGTVQNVETSAFTGIDRTTVSTYIDLHDHFFDGGTLYVTYNTGAIISRTIKKFLRADSSNALYTAAPTIPLEVTNNRLAKVFHFDSPLPAGTVVSFRALQADSVPWNPAILNGRKSIVYRLVSDPDLTNPNFNISNVYGPLRPTSITSDRTLLYSGILPLPAPNDNDTLLGAYWSISPQLAKIKAYTGDTFCDSGIIVTQETKFYVTLPQSMFGVYIADSQKVPYGFRLMSDDFDAASVLNAATFLNINMTGQYNYNGPYISAPTISGGDIVLSSETFSGMPMLHNVIEIT